MMLYTKNPPTTLPNRDLSSVKSSVGLHLGMTTAEVARLYRVSLSAIKRLPNGRRVLALEKSARCASAICEHVKIVVFENDRAVSISLHDHGP